MRGSIVVLALAVTPFVAQAQHRPHWQRHDMPAASHRNDDKNDKKCDVRTRGNSPANDHRADPRLKGNKDCDVSTNSGGGDQSPPPPPPPSPDPAPEPLGHTQIQGSLFFDVDNDGYFGTDEVGLAGWTVVASGPMIVSSVTDGSGAYTLSGLTAGVYTVCVSAPAGWRQTAPSAGTGPTCANATVGMSIEAPALVGDVWYSGVDFGFVSM
jgi:hypothetical protein